MKLKGLSIFAALNLTLLSTQVLADIVIQSPFAGKQDVCEQIAGHWTGGGTATLISIIKCVYKGSGDITSSKPGELNINNLTLDVKPSESSFLCPTHETLSLSGQCHNGKIIIHNDAAKLDGELVNEGKTANVEGTVTFTVPVIGRITPAVKMVLNKS